MYDGPVMCDGPGLHLYIDGQLVCPYVNCFIFYDIFFKNFTDDFTVAK